MPDLGSAGFDAVTRASALRGDVARLAAEGVRLRRLSPELVELLRGSGLFRMLVPREIGGHEVAPQVLVDAIEAVAESDAGTAWCMMIGATTGLTAALLDPQAAKEIFADPGVITGGVFAPDGRAEDEGDHYRVTGAWRWATGNTHATWMAGGCLVMGPDGPRMGANGVPENRMVFWRTQDCTLTDTWNTIGLEATGSYDMAVRDLRVPKARSVSLMTDRPWATGALYRFPSFGCLAIGIAGVALGNARAALRDLADLSGAKRPKGSRKTLGEKAYAQRDFAIAQARLSAARAYLREAIDAAWQDALAAREVTGQARAAIRLAAAHATRESLFAAQTAFDLGGGSAVYLDSPLPRRLRDAQVACQHMMVGHPVYEAAGRVFMGQPALDPSF
jgi:alkylation response protein AidB-like acyl-CoA dehydrogenase